MATWFGGARINETKTIELNEKGFFLQNTLT